MSASVFYSLWAFVVLVAPLGVTLVVILTRRRGVQVALVTVGVSCALCVVALALAAQELWGRLTYPSNVVAGLLVAIPGHAAVLAVSRLDIYERLPWAFLPVGPLSYWAAAGAGAAIVAFLWYGMLL